MFMHLYSLPTTTYTVNYEDTLEHSWHARALLALLYDSIVPGPTVSLPRGTRGVQREYRHAGPYHRRSSGVVSSTEY